MHWPEHNRDTRCTLHMQGLENLMLCLSGEECTVVGIFSISSFLSLPFPSSDQQDQHQSRPRRGVIIPPPDWPDWARAGRAG